MVLNYHAANYTGWPLSRFIIMVQRYKKYLNYTSVYVNIFSEYLLKNTKPCNTFSMAFEKVLESFVARNA